MEKLLDEKEHTCEIREFKTRRLCCHHFRCVFKIGITILSTIMSGNQGASGLQKICALMLTDWTYCSAQQAVLSINGINRMVCPGACRIWQMFQGQSDSLSALCIYLLTCGMHKTL